MACLFGLSLAAEDQAAEEIRLGHWEGNAWGRHNGGGWSRVGSSPWGASSWGTRHGYRHARSIEDLAEEENRIRSWSANHGSFRGSWGSSHGSVRSGSWGVHGSRHTRCVEDLIKEENRIRSWTGNHGPWSKSSSQGSWAPVHSGSWGVHGSKWGSH